MKRFFAYWMLKLYFSVIFATCKIEVHNVQHFKASLKNNRSIMLGCWHEHLVFLLAYVKSLNNKIWVVSSTHRDSAVLAKLLSAWNFQLIKGSSTRGWFGVIKSLSKLFKTPDALVAITCDGPKGPRRKAKEGALKIALKNNVVVQGFSGLSSRFWTLGSWDQLKIPFPFSTIHINFGSSYELSDNTESFNNYLNNIENKLYKIINDNIN